MAWGRGEASRSGTGSASASVALDTGTETQGGLGVKTVTFRANNSQRSFQVSTDNTDRYGPDVPAELPAAGRPPSPDVRGGVSRRSSFGAGRGKKIGSAIIRLRADEGRCMAKLYMNPAFENAALIVILLNSVWIGIEVDYRHKMSSWAFESGENFFCAVFTLELAIRMLAYLPRFRDYFTDPESWKWNLFDFALVGVMIVETWVLKYLVKLEASQLQALMLLRLFRLLRMTRIFRMVPELAMMIKSMIAAVRTVSSTCVLAMGIMYCFAILFTQWVKTSYPDGRCIAVAEGGQPIDIECGAERLADGGCMCLQDYFGSMTETLLVLMQILVLDDTFEILRPVIKERFAYGFLLIVYIVLVAFTVMNMLIGVICDVISDTSAEEKHKVLRMNVEEVFHGMDTDGSGQVSRKEFEQDESLAQLESLGIEGPVLKNAFDIADYNFDGSLDMKEFCQMIFKCLDPVQSQDVLKIQLQVNQLADTVGVGREATAVLSKERLKYSRSRTGQTLDNMEDSHGSASAAISDLDLVEHAARKHGEENRDVQEFLSGVHSRLSTLGHRLEELRLDPAGTSRGGRGSGSRPDGQWVVQPSGAPLGRSGARSPSPEPTEAAMEIRNPTHARRLGTLGTHLRVLHAQLHALRAEFKAAEMKYAGGMNRSGREQHAPLDQAINEVITNVADVRSYLRVLFPPEPSTTAALEMPGTRGRPDPSRLGVGAGVSTEAVADNRSARRSSGDGMPIRADAAVPSATVPRPSSDSAPYGRATAGAPAALLPLDRVLDNPLPLSSSRRAAGDDVANRHPTDVRGQAAAARVKAQAEAAVQAANNAEKHAADLEAEAASWRQAASAARKTLEVAQLENEVSMVLLENSDKKAVQGNGWPRPARAEGARALPQQNGGHVAHPARLRAGAAERRPPTAPAADSAVHSQSDLGVANPSLPPQQLPYGRGEFADRPQAARRQIDSGPILNSERSFQDYDSFTASRGGDDAPPTPPPLDVFQEEYRALGQNGGTGEAATVPPNPRDIWEDRRPVPSRPLPNKAAPRNASPPTQLSTRFNAADEIGHRLAAAAKATAPPPGELSNENYVFYGRRDV